MGENANTIEVFIEIPLGSRNKYEWDKQRRLLKLDVRPPRSPAVVVPGGTTPTDARLNAPAAAALYVGFAIVVKPVAVISRMIV